MEPGSSWCCQVKGWEAMSGNWHTGNSTWIHMQVYKFAHRCMQVHIYKHATDYKDNYFLWELGFSRVTLNKWWCIALTRGSHMKAIKKSSWPLKKELTDRCKIHTKMEGNPYSENFRYINFKIKRPQKIHRYS